MSWLGVRERSFLPRNHADVALNTDPTHDGYVGIICTQTVRRLCSCSIGLSHLANCRTCTTLFMKRLRMLGSCVKSIMPCSRVRRASSRSSLVLTQLSVSRSSRAIDMSTGVGVPLCTGTFIPYLLRVVEELVACGRRAIRTRGGELSADKGMSTIPS